MSSDAKPWKRPKASYEYHRAYLVRFGQRKRDEEAAKDSLEPFEWHETPQCWLEQAPFLLRCIQEHPSWALETKRTYLNALKQLLRIEYEKQIVPPEESNRWLQVIEQVSEQHSMATNETLRSEKDNALKNSGRDTRWIPWNEILAIFDSLAHRCEENPLNYRLAQMRLMLAMYVWQPAPLRLNYSCVRLFPDEAERRVLDEHGHNYVYEDNESHRMRFQLNDDKVVQSRGSVTIDVDERLSSIIRSMERHFGYRRYLLTHPTDYTKPLDQDSGQKAATIRMLASIPVKDEERPAQLSVCSIRSAFVTRFLEQNPSENAIEQVAREMRTSVPMMRIYYRKIVTHPTQT